MSNIYWKLQSINQTDELEIDSQEYDIYREHYKKDYETRELMTMQETVEHYRLQAWKNPLFSRIFSLTVAIVEDNLVKVIYYTGNEKDLLQTFLNTLKKDRFKEYTVTHFGAEYILPYLGTRIDMNGIRTTIPTGLQYKNMKSWNLSGCCVRNYYSGAGNYKNNLKELAWIYDLETDFIDSVDEFTYYKAGKLEELKNSAVNEIHTLVNVHRLMTGETVVEERTCSELFVEAVEEVKPVNILETLYLEKRFSAEIKKELQKKFIKKKPTKKDKEGIQKILLAHYLEKVELMDFEKVKAEKNLINLKRTEEITEYIKSL